MQLRIRCVDGRELFVERDDDERAIRVAELKRLIVQQLGLVKEEKKTEEEEDDDSDGVESYVLFRGNILADVDYFDLVSLAPSDFFVFAYEEPVVMANDGFNGEANISSEEEEMKQHEPTRKRKWQEEDLIKQQRLTEMGFSVSQAQMALKQTHYDLSSAIALLMGEEPPPSDNSSSMRKKSDDALAKLLLQYPSLWPLESLLQQPLMSTLREVAAKNSFDALVLLKDEFPDYFLTAMNDNPVATLRFLTLPPSVSVGESKNISLAQNKSVFNIADEEVNGNGSVDQAAIDRLLSMGFAPDLVLAVYESCGQNEELAANALLETLE